MTSTTHSVASAGLGWPQQREVSSGALGWPGPAFVDVSRETAGDATSGGAPAPVSRETAPPPSPTVGADPAVLDPAVLDPAALEPADAEPAAVADAPLGGAPEVVDIDPLSAPLEELVSRETT